MLLVCSASVKKNILFKYIFYKWIRMNLKSNYRKKNILLFKKAHYKIFTINTFKLPFCYYYSSGVHCNRSTCIPDINLQIVRISSTFIKKYQIWEFHIKVLVTQIDATLPGFLWISPVWFVKTEIPSCFYIQDMRTKMLTFALSFGLNIWTT